jgi:hypothetical protein
MQIDGEPDTMVELLSYLGKWKVYSVYVKSFFDKIEEQPKAARTKLL